MTDAVNTAFVSAAGLGAVDPLLVWIAAACIATLLAQAAVAKWADLALLEQHLAAYGLPAAALRAGALALPMAEGTVALLLLTPLRGLGALLAAGLPGDACLRHFIAHAAAFGDGEGEGLLTVDVLAIAGGIDGEVGMPSLPFKICGTVKA